MPSRTLFVVAAALAFAALVSAPAAGQGRGRGSGAAAQEPPPPGDAANGKALVEANKCLTCHRIDDRGSRFGPDLSAVGASRSPQQLARALVAPDDDVLPEHREIRVVTKAGATVTGRLLNQDAFSVQLIDDKEELKSFQRSALREATILQTGLMPSFQGKLADQQVNDMVNYLASLKGAQ
jgi:putative heme-binding domain-containing protein